MNKPLDSFKRNAHTPDGRTYVCLDCIRARPRGAILDGLDDRRERQLARLRERHATDAAYRERMHHNRRKSEYGVTREQWEAVLEAQGGVCAICKGGPTGSRGFYLDHNHETLVIRGLLCGHCNTAIGMFSDDPERIARAIDYVGSADTGLVMRIRPKRKTAECGTISGYNRHRTAGEVICRECQTAWREYQAAYRASLPPRERKRNKVAPCGTCSGYMRHYTAGEPICDPCRQAKNAYVRDRARAKREAAQSSLEVT